MAPESRHFDRASALAGQLLALECELDELGLEGFQKVELLKDRAALEGSLAVAEALRGCASDVVAELRNVALDVRHVADAGGGYCMAGNL